MSTAFRAIAFGPFDQDEYKCFQKPKPEPAPKPEPTHKKESAEVIKEMVYLERLYRLEGSRLKMAPEMQKPILKACLN